LPQRVLFRVLGVRWLGISLATSSNWSQLSRWHHLGHHHNTNCLFCVYMTIIMICGSLQSAKRCELNAPLLAVFRAASGLVSGWSPSRMTPGRLPSPLRRRERQSPGRATYEVWALAWTPPRCILYVPHLNHSCTVITRPTDHGLSWTKLQSRQLGCIQR
jgi:hypothetical protein